MQLEIHACNNVREMQPNEVTDETAGDEVDSTGIACADNPRSNKPLMEKRRRARINKSLNELKTMLLEALKGNSCGHSKLEKADILEMTVRYMRKLEQHRARTTRIDPNVLNKYKAGFNECSHEVMKFLSTHEGVSVEVRTRLLDHLASCQQSLQDQGQENLMEEEFIGADVSSSWRFSPVSAEETASRVSPSESQVAQVGNDGINERIRSSPTAEEPNSSDIECLPGNTYVGGQIQIIATGVPFSPSKTSSLCTPVHNPLKNVPVACLPTSRRTRSLGSSETVPHNSCAHTSGAAGNGEHVVMPPPQIAHHISRGNQDEATHARNWNNQPEQQSFYGIGNVLPQTWQPRTDYRSKANSEGSSTDVSLSPEFRPETWSTMDSSQLDFLDNKYRQSPDFSTHSDANNLSQLQKSKGPWRPWSHNSN